MPDAKHTDLSAHTLRSRLDYDPATGLFRWRVTSEMPDRWNTRWAGTVAGERNGKTGRVTIRINYVKYLAARLAWLWIHGEWPVGVIDHIDGNPSNDRIENLRQATQQQNLFNRRPSRRNALGLKGVSFNRARGKWVASITLDGRQRTIGRYGTAEEAAAAYQAEAQRLFGSFAWVA